MAFTELPTELKIQILNYTDPVSTLHFALAGKVYWRLLQSRLEEHAALFKKYAYITPVGEEAGEEAAEEIQENRSSVWDITKEILRDPRKGQYVRVINLVADCPESRHDLSEEDKETFSSAAEEMLRLYAGKGERGFWAAEDENSESLEEAMRQPGAFEQAETVVAILLHYCPELRSFKMTAHGCGALALFLRRLAACYQIPEMAASLPLQNLKTVAVAHDDTEGSCGMEWAVYFLCVPSVRTFAALMMGSEDIHMFGDYDEDEEGEGEANAGNELYLRNTAGAPVSNVQELVLHQCQFDPHSFNTLLPLIKDLKSFCYESGGHTVAYSDVQPKRVIKALAKHCAHSLEEVNMLHGLTDMEVRFPSLPSPRLSN